MSSEVSLLVELYNPLYLFPIVAVVCTALMVYAFGFKSSTQPPTEVVDALNDKHHKNVKTPHETVKRRKPTQKVINSKSEPKTQPNGHITSESNRTTEKKTLKKVAPEQTTSAPTAKISGKNKKNKKSEDIDVDVEDKNSGEWVEIMSSKERKSRKQKEELLLTLTKNEKNKDYKIKVKPAIPKKNKPLTNEVINGEENSSPKKSKETVEEVAKPAKEPIPTKKQNGALEEIVAERDIPDVYGLAKEQRAPKKTQKQKNTKRNSESEPNSRAESSPEKEPKSNINLSDKLTAAIVANYEANDNKTDNTSNKKKKEKKKKTLSQTSDALNGKPTPQRNEENNASNVMVVENSKPDIPIATEVKPTEEEEFKQVVNKKRRARRE